MNYRGIFEPSFKLQTCILFMLKSSGLHTFHIPVMGLGYTVDTPLKVAKFGISSVVSIMDDFLLEDMRRIHSEKLNLLYSPITETEEDARAKRVQAYLDLLHTVIEAQMAELKTENWDEESSMSQLVALLPEESEVTGLFEQFRNTELSERSILKSKIIELLTPGSIDVNIMTKVDKLNYDKEGNELSREFSDALSALRGFAKSKLEAAVVFSAGMNPALYSYAEQFPDFFPDENGKIKKRIILKVSDYRSALIQGKFLAKKGLWVSEFRIESGLNCGGHAFATDGFLAGPILEDFKTNRKELIETIIQTCNQGLEAKGQSLLPDAETIKITYQGGIGTGAEDSFLRSYYQLDGTGWGSPFLLVPEATSVDEETIQKIINAKKSDYFLSHASPLGVPFNNLRTSSGEIQRQQRIDKGRPGSPCFKKFLTFSTEFTDKPICTASRQYQNLKSKAFHEGKVGQQEMTEILEKDCLCEGLSAPAILANDAMPRRNLNAVTICPGPNLAYFKSVFSLKEMVDHIYGKITLKLENDRPHVFVKEAQLYVDYLKKEFQKLIPEATAKQEAYLEKFRNNLNIGLSYYQELVNSFQLDSEEILEKMKAQLKDLQAEIELLRPSV